MATPATCYAVVRGKVARLTRLDGCGKPLPGECSTIITEDIVQITASAEIEEGEEITVKNMAGKLCISDKPCDSLKWYNVEITLCKVFPQLYGLVAGYRQIRDARGEVVGYGIKSNIDCEGGFALEVWGDVPGTKCGEGAGSTQLDYLIFPWISAATLSGDIEIGNSARQPVLTGRTKTGGSWGNGPYDVEADINGVPGPLIEPIDSDAHVWDLKVTVPAPIPSCECHSLSSPDGPIVVAEENETNCTPVDPAHRLLNVIATPRPPATAPAGGWMVSWGDGSPPEALANGGTGECHAYPISCTTLAPCTFVVKVWDPALPADQQQPTFTEVTIPLA